MYIYIYRLAINASNGGTTASIATQKLFNCYCIAIAVSIIHVVVHVSRISRAHMWFKTGNSVRSCDFKSIAHLIASVLIAVVSLLCLRAIVTVTAAQLRREVHCCNH
jgi:hypothetical protein